MYLDTSDDRYKSGPIAGKKDKDAEDPRTATAWVANIDDGDTVVHIDEDGFRHSIIVLDDTGRDALITALMDADADATGDMTIVNNQTSHYEIAGERVIVSTMVVRYPLDDEDAATG